MRPRRRRKFRHLGSNGTKTFVPEANPVPRPKPLLGKRSCRLQRQQKRRNNSLARLARPSRKESATTLPKYSNRTRKNKVGTRMVRRRNHRRQVPLLVTVTLTSEFGLSCCFAFGTFANEAPLAYQHSSGAMSLHDNKGIHPYL